MGEAPQTVEGAYLQRVEDGRLTLDQAQREAARLLDDVLANLKSAKPAGFFRKADKVTGLYLWGGVGRGKSMLMDLFSSLSPVPVRRAHFHEFMAGVHDDFNDWRNMDESARKKSDHYVRSAGSDPVAPVAKKIADSARLLCFDEFQVSQIADAMILSRLFEQLFDRGVTVVATSNRHPDELYKDGLNRQLFLPFIERLKSECDVFELVSDRDYRLERLTEAPVWHAPAANATAAMDRAFDRLTMGAEPRQCSLRVKGRDLPIPREAAGVARFAFADLCERPLGPIDYLAIAANFHTVLIDNIPRLGTEKRNEAARFVSLIDALYEAKVKLIASANADPDDLYPSGDGSFEFQRTVSRLHEMASVEYMAQEHVVPKRSEKLTAET